MALILPCGRPSIHTSPLFSASSAMLTEGASVLVLDSYFPIAGKISASVVAVCDVIYFPSYLEVIAVTVGFFLGSHVFVVGTAVVTTCGVFVAGVVDVCCALELSAARQ